MPILTQKAQGYTELELETSEKNKIQNTQIREFSPSELSKLRKIKPCRGEFLNLRCKATPIYNCHGLVFASRRTGIWVTEAIYKILEDDKYVEVDEKNVLPGDIILYVGKDGDMEHSGIVIEPPRVETYNVAIVCSKWGKYAEGIHWANNVPYDYSQVRYYRVYR